MKIKKVEHVLRKSTFFKSTREFLKTSIKSSILLKRLRKLVEDVYCGKPLVIVVGRRMLQKDVDQIVGEAPNFTFIVVSHKIWRGAQGNFTPKHLQEQTFYKEKSLQCGYDWSRNMAWADRVLRSIGRHRIAAVVNSNFDYWQDYAFHLKCKEEGIPFIVMMRENHVSRASVELFLERYSNFRADVSGIAAASSVQKKLLSETGVIDDRDIWVTGYPRNDPALAFRSDPLDKKANSVLFLGHDSLSYGLKDIKSYEYCLNEFVGAFANNRNVDEIVIKAKDADSRKRHIDMIRGSLRDNFVSNKLKIVSEPSVFELVSKSRVVVGGNSQSTVEALLSTVPVVFPKFIVTEGSPYDIFIDYNSYSDARVRFSSDISEFTRDLLYFFNHHKPSNGNIDIVKSRERFFGQNIFFDVDKPSAAYFVEMLSWYYRLSAGSDSYSVEYAREKRDLE